MLTEDTLLTLLDLALRRAVEAEAKLKQLQGFALTSAALRADVDGEARPKATYNEARP